MALYGTLTAGPLDMSDRYRPEITGNNKKVNFLQAILHLLNKSRAQRVNH